MMVWQRKDKPNTEYGDFHSRPPMLNPNQPTTPKDTDPMKAIILSTLTVLAAYGFLGMKATDEGNKVIQEHKQTIENVQSNYDQH